MGQFIVDSTPTADLTGKAEIVCRVSVPSISEAGSPKDRIDPLCDQILIHLKAGTGKFNTVNGLETDLRAKGVKFTKTDLAPALQRLVNHSQLEWPEVGERQKRPGWLLLEEQE
jgi:hypothetical protein